LGVEIAEPVTTATLAVGALAALATPFALTLLAFDIVVGTEPDADPVALATEAVDSAETEAAHAEALAPASPPTYASSLYSSVPVTSSTCTNMPDPEVSVHHQLTLVPVTLAKVAMGSSLSSLQSVKTQTL